MSTFTTDIHSGISSAQLRHWQTNVSLNLADFIYPLFIKYDKDCLEEIDMMPNQKRIGCNKLVEYVTPLVKKGLKSVLLFGICHPNEKDEKGTAADDKSGPVASAVLILKKQFPSLCVACDVCLCAYTSHGHCGVLAGDGEIDNTQSVKRLADVALTYALAGCDIVAPSDCMDGRVKAIKDILASNGLKGRVSLMSYSAKFASSFYGPFRSAAQSSPGFGDRKCYQLPPGSRGLAMRAVKRDVEEGADILMVKPGLAYLDIIRDIKEKYPDFPLAVYHVSGEYSMLLAAHEKGYLDMKRVAIETMMAFKRAGASIIISYMVPYLLDLGHDELQKLE